LSSNEPPYGPTTICWVFGFWLSVVARMEGLDNECVQILIKQLDLTQELMFQKPKLLVKEPPTRFYSQN